MGERSRALALLNAAQDNHVTHFKVLNRHVVTSLCKKKRDIRLKREVMNSNVQLHYLTDLPF